MGNSVCKFNLEQYSEETCTTAKSTGLWASSTSVSFTLNYNQCYNPSGASYSMKWNICDPTAFVAYTNYADTACVNLDTDHPV